METVLGAFVIVAFVVYAFCQAKVGYDAARMMERQRVLSDEALRAQQIEVTGRGYR